MNNDFARLVGLYLQDADVREEQRTLAQRIIAGLGVVCLLVLILIAATWPTKAHAVQLDHQGCMALAVWSHDVVLMRDVGADKEKVRAYFREQDTKDQPVFGLLLKAFEKLWATAEPRENIAPPIYQDCVRRRGNYGTDV